MAEIVTNYTPEVWTPGSKLTAAQMTALSAAVDQVEETMKEKLDVEVPVSQFVSEKVAALVNSAPETLDTLGELATALQEKGEAVEALNKLVTTNKTAIENVSTSLQEATTSFEEKSEQLTDLITENSTAITSKTDKLVNIKSVGSTKIDHDGSTAYVTSVDSNAMGTQGVIMVDSQNVRVEVSEKHEDAKKVSSVQLTKDELRLVRRNAEGTIFSVEVADIDKAIKAIPTLATTEQLKGKIDVTAADEKFAEKNHKHVTSDITDLQGKLDEKLNASEAFTKESADKLYAAIAHNHDEVYVKTAAIADMLTKTEAGKLYAGKTHTHAIANVEGLQAALDGKQAAGEYATVAQLGEKVATADYQNDKKTFALKSELADKLDSADAFKQSDADKLYVKVGDAFTQVAADALYVKVSEAFTQVAADKLYAAAVHTHKAADISDLQGKLDEKLNTSAAFTKEAADKLYAVVAHNHDEVYVKKSDYDAKIQALEARLEALETPKP